MLVEHGGQHAVVRGDELVVAGLGGDASARRSDAGIDDDQEYCAARKVLVRRREFERAGNHIVRGDVM